jgi:hypothetical protein
MKIKVNCTWGDGPDVLLQLFTKDGTRITSFDLTSEEALDLAVDLEKAAEWAKQMERMAKDHDGEYQ